VILLTDPRNPWNCWWSRALGRPAGGIPHLATWFLWTPAQRLHSRTPLPSPRAVETHCRTLIPEPCHRANANPAAFGLARV